MKFLWWKYAAAAAVVVPTAITALRLVSFFTRKVTLSEAHVGTLVADVLKAHGVRYIFLLPGGHVSPVVVGCEAAGIRIIDVRNEADAVFAADATSRLTGTIGVAIVTAGPGVTNAITAMKNSQMAHSPLLLIGGAAATITKGRGALQDIDQISLLHSIAKVAKSITRIQDVVPTLRYAISVAQSGVPGPVFIEIPIDLMYPILELQSQLGLVQRKAKIELGTEDIPKVIVPVEHRLKGRDAYLSNLGPSEPVFLPSKRPLHPIISLFVNWQVRRIFGDAWIDRPVSPLPLSIPRARDSVVRNVRRLLLSSRRPMLIIGSQIVVNANVDKVELSKTLQHLGIPCYLSGMSRGIMGYNHPCFLRHNRRHALKDADFVLLLGVSVDFRLDYGRVFNNKCCIVSINRAAVELKRNTDVFWTPTVSVLADPADFVVRIAACASELRFANRDAEWVSKLKRSDEERDVKIAREAEAVATGRGMMQCDKLVNPLKLFLEIAATLRDRNDIIIIGDGGDFVGTAAYILRPNGPCSWLDPGPYGTLGIGGGFALAAKLAHPEKHVFLFWGDGSAAYSLAEFDAFVRHKCPIIAIVGNDACWSQIVRDQNNILRSEIGCNLAYCRYDLVAQSYGNDCSDAGGSKKVVGETIRRAEDVVPAVKRAIDNSASGTSTLLNVLIGRSAFREGSSSV